MPSVFARAAVTLLFFAGFAACSSASSTDGPSAAGATADAGGNAPATSDGGGAPTDAGATTITTTTDAAPQPTGTCPAPIGAFPESEYLHPMHALQKGACSATDLDTLAKIGLGSYAARRSLVSASCAKCVYSDAADASWGLLVVVDADTALTNYAGCAAVAGDTRPCVKMNSAWRFCTRKACATCPAKGQSACAESESMSGQCKTYYDADQACGGDWPTGCTSSDEMIATYCGP